MITREKLTETWFLRKICVMPKNGNPLVWRRSMGRMYEEYRKDCGKTSQPYQDWLKLAKKIGLRFYLNSEKELTSEGFCLEVDVTPKMLTY
jgi:hypothetical protein